MNFVTKIRIVLIIQCISLCEMRIVSDLFRGCEFVGVEQLEALVVDFFGEICDCERALLSFALFAD